MANELWRLPKVKAVTGIGTTMVYELIKRGDFPAPIPTTGRCRAWVSGDVQAWIDARIEAARKTPKAA